LTFFEIPSDGNWLAYLHSKMMQIFPSKLIFVFPLFSDEIISMYAAILHQINPKGSASGVVQTVQQLRNMAADFMRSHPDDFMPFMDEVSSEEQFIKYCNDVQRTAAWGSQLEVTTVTLDHKNVDTFLSHHLLDPKRLSIQNDRLVAIALLGG